MFKPIKTQKINSNLYVIKTLIVNCYIYDTGNELIVFDTGINRQLLKMGFRKLRLDYNKVSYVFLTHSDFDHVGGLKLFRNAKIFISKEEEPLITWKKARRGILYNRKINGCNFVENSEIVNIDNISIKIILTPGHTMGSIIYLINNDVLITGDTISLTADGTIKNFSFVQNMNHKKNIETVGKLIENKLFDNVLVVATGHHGILRK
jgi:Zn-dependent hydrolases, including glyoxylases